jgi:hypothetical protein
MDDIFLKMRLGRALKFVGFDVVHIEIGYTGIMTSTLSFPGTRGEDESMV